MIFLALIFLGIFTGLIAGMLGIGGGVLIVPGLTIIFSYMGVFHSLDVKYAIATSLCIMIFTAISSCYGHYKNKNILFDVFKKTLLSIILGTIVGVFIAHLISSSYLEIFFGIFLFFVALKMFIGFKIKKHKRIYPQNSTFWLIGSVIGLKSGILGVGGGTLSVPVLSYLGFPTKKAIGTSASFTLPIAIIGSIAFMFLGFEKSDVTYSTGYIYWPAFFVVAPFTLIFAFLGAKLTHYVPERILQVIFGIILIILSFKMLFSNFI